MCCTVISWKTSKVKVSEDGHDHFIGLPTEAVKNFAKFIGKHLW